MAKGYGFEINDWVLVGAIVGGVYLLNKTGFLKTISNVGNTAANLTGYVEQVSNIPNLIPNNQVWRTDLNNLFASLG